MSDNVTRVRVFVASPGDVASERKHLQDLVDEYNRVDGAQDGVALELVRWETHARPGLGRAQELINRQIGAYDVFVGIMWKRFGTPTGVADSGTEEEFDIACEAWSADAERPVLFYFCQQPFMPANAAEVEQFGKVLAFRKRLDGIGLTWSYDSPSMFKDTVRPHLIQALRALREGPGAAPTAPSGRARPARAAPRKAAIDQLLAAARMQREHRDYGGAWNTLLRAAEAGPDDVEVPGEQTQLAMAWLRDFRRSRSQTFGEIIDPLLPVLYRAATVTSGSDGADVLAHLGWAYLMKDRDRGAHDPPGDIDPESYFASALKLDPNNAYARAMWAYSMRWTVGVADQVREHFAAAIASGRDRGFIRQLQLLALAGLGNEVATVDLIRAVDEMRRNGEDLSAEERSRVRRNIYESGGIEGLFERLPSVLPAADHLATYRWLIRGLEDDRSTSREFWLARLLEANGDARGAMALYLAMLSIAGGMEEPIKKGIDRCAALGEQVVPSLLRSLAEGDAPARASAAESLAACGAGVGSALPALVAALEDADAQVRANAAQTLGAIGAGSPEVLDALLRRLRDPSHPVRAVSGTALAAIGAPAVAPLAELLADADPRVRRHAATALGAFAATAEPAVPALAKLLKDPDVEARAAAAEALGEVGPGAAPAVPAIVAALRGDVQPRVRARAAHSLAKVGPGAWEAVAALCDALAEALASDADGDGFTSMPLADALGNIGPAAREAVPLLVSALGSEHLRIPEAAAGALGRIGADAGDAIPALLAAMERQPAEYRGNQAEPLTQIVEALAQKPSAEALASARKVLGAFQQLDIAAKRVARLQVAVDALQDWAVKDR